ncbi:MAG TPA: hypothetical protein QGF95_09590 [Candidatus Latescibacteria bacterium]|nr:hypothetical protein [Candidatus Latescibacterota bacterium]HJP30793.1 hypothetical protein [Candidatus Latescibacterota bacterium]
MTAALPYLRLVRFLLPLVVTMVIAGLMPQFLAGGIARGSQPTETLAAFALAWGLAEFLASPLSQVRQLALVLVRHREQARQVLRFVTACGLLLGAIVALLALTPAGTFVVEDLHNTSPDLGKVVRFALLLLIPYPLLAALQRWLSGLLMRVRRTEIVSAGMLCGIGASLLTVFVAVPTALVRDTPIALPLLVTYAGVITNMTVLWVGARRYAHPGLRLGADHGDSTDLTFAYLGRFFWPLALTMAIQGLSRPVVNLFVSRGTEGEQALAALAVVYSLAHLPYGWLNELRCLPPVFDEYGPAGLRRIRRFACLCGALSFTTMAIAFWFPTVRDLLLLDLLALSPALADRCHVPLVLFSFFPLTVAARAYLQGVALSERRTAALAPSAPARIAAILLVLVLVPMAWMPGATRGLAALLTGFVVEAVVVWWFVHARRPDSLPAPGART